MLPAWVNRYLGVEWRNGGRTLDGLDCWGLVRLVLLEQFKVEFPLFDDFAYTVDHAKVLALYDEWHSRFIDVEMGQEQPGDMVVMFNRGVPIHLGIVPARGYVLHCEGDMPVCAQRFGDVRTPRVSAIWRPKQLAGVSHV